MINRAVLTGRLTRDPEVRYTQSGAAVGSFTLAVDRQFTNQQGQREADFINCVIWRKSAENFANFTHKGSLVGIEGRIQTRNYENQQGQRVYVTEVVVENFALLESRSQSDQRTSGNTNDNGGYNNNAPQSGSANPFGGTGNNGGNNAGNAAPSSQTSQAPADPFAGNGESIDISDDDLPF
ncbi:MAG: single-stranded DNA-binding protein [Furfurilactobacillus sp.]|jgi:single-strand DNA-binding protein|uniref:Single-stranded DNA-binding protein n=2 Tax=Furfurilactobacillus TaxID=2767882 RepID=A0A6N9HYR6_9LACO|nr:MULTISPECIES: single-stranded DNA-binding protein [Furfurilactobacillus]QLE65364.1 Single-stranded DNA-binding protein [Furfurilactobacillus rossiae]MCF6160863.1 single-stranded DNA-binding protein [Furfurilactobacillus milii]MCF6163371.1 single-stranded DNA-binding protein [Furfurilactobacillus milii]MCF6418365.1 single-stranded DNA-binding protein [Furfurilactobacillus milii]MCH4011882.1 single-stranded DNA-binding protein [Furfurilactobacillus sp.]